MKKNGDWLYENNYFFEGSCIALTRIDLTGTFSVVFSLLDWKIKSKYENYI